MSSPSDTDRRTARIRELNDACRAGDGGQVFVTDGVRANGPKFVTEVCQAVAAFDDFTPENDPYGQHDFGALTVSGERLFWKIDYYDLALEGHSPDPMNPAVTRRVLTIMLASEY
jgi:hypothetical protein